jgi:hypothetical protein
VSEQEFPGANRVSETQKTLKIQRFFMPYCVVMPLL